jgi:hypothetical protein
MFKHHQEIYNQYIAGPIWLSMEVCVASPPQRTHHETVCMPWLFLNRRRKIYVRFKRLKRIVGISNPNLNLDYITNWTVQIIDPFKSDLLYSIHLKDKKKKNPFQRNVVV